MSLGAAENRLARFHLEDGIDQLEREAIAGRYNTLCTRALGNAAILLGVGDVAARATCLLRAVPDNAFFAGAITNIELPQAVPDAMRELGRPEELAKRHPIYCEHDIRERIRSYAADEKHFALCLAGRVREARLEAVSGRQLEEVGEALAVLGDFDAALSVSCDPALEEFRQHGVRFVIGIEFLRRGRAAEADGVFARLGAAKFGAWERVHLALGCGGREPWGGYPFPDW
jgi:hypothetical protein